MAAGSAFAHLQGEKVQVRKRLASRYVVIALAWCVCAAAVRGQFTSDYQTNFISGVVSNWAGDYVVGSNTVFNLLQIENGGVLSDTVGFIGYATGADNNTTIITGPGSVWSSSTLVIGRGGANNRLIITNGGAAHASSTTGFGESSTGNVVVVTGPGSLWKCGNLILGRDGAANQLRIAAGGKVQVDDIVWVGEQRGGSNNTVSVCGSGSVWGVDQDVYLGSQSPSNRLMIANQGAVVSRQFVVGQLPSGSNNVATISGTGSIWKTTTDLTVGFASPGNLLAVADAATIVCGRHCYLGGGSVEPGIPAEGTLTLTGSSLYCTNGTLTVGHAGGGVGCLIATNAIVWSRNLTAGNLDGSRGRVSVTDSSVAVGQVTVGWMPGSAGSFHAAGASLVATSKVWIGLGGEGVMFLTNCTLSTGFLGIAGGGTAHGRLTAIDSTLNDSGTLSVGDFQGTGVVWFTRGTLAVTNGITYVGFLGTGQMTCSNSLVNLATLTVGASMGHAGTLTLIGGTVTASGTLTIAEQPFTRGTVWVTGGELFTTNRPTYVGYSGVGQMTISNGTVQAYVTTVGSLTGSCGTLTIVGGTNLITGGCILGMGSGSTGTMWLVSGRIDGSVSNSIVIADQGVGNFTMSNGTARLRHISVGQNSGSSGTFTLTAGTITTKIGAFGGVGFSLGSTVNSKAMAWIKGGQFDSSETDIAVAQSGTASLTVSNGNVGARNLFVASAGGSGTLTIAGGTSCVYSDLTVGTTCAATGVVLVTGGSLFVTNPTHNAVLEIRSGTVSVSGGMLQIDSLVVTNTCARFVHTGGNLSIESLLLDPAMDADGDGLPNGWEQANGLNPLALDAEDDNDGDGLTNAQEFMAGTNPAAANSYFGITDIVQEGDDIRITWMTGIGKTNQLQSTRGTTDGSYTNVFNDVGLPIIATTTVTNQLDEGSAINATSLYYRVWLVP